MKEAVLLDDMSMGKHPLPPTTKRKRTTGSKMTATSSNSNLDNHSSSTEEDKDMAHCLVLLSHGHASDPSSASENSSYAKLSESMKRFDVYECKTCDRSFHSFQALGGHSASHKKPKLLPNEQEPKNSISTCSKLKVHECSICGAEFSSGQALGGHMRRHRQITSSQNLHLVEKEEEKDVFLLDLNLPAPSDENPKVSQRLMVCTPVGECHY